MAALQREEKVRLSSSLRGEWLVTFSFKGSLGSNPS